MEPLAILSLVLFVALTVAFVGFVRRAGALVAVIRDHERFQAQVADLDARTASAIEPLLSLLEDVRHRRVHAEPVVDRLQGVSDIVRTAADEASRLRTPSSLRDVPPSLAEAYTKAERALRLVEHGVVGLVGTRGGPRELEAQTSLKRGALALRNARADALAIAQRVAAAPAPNRARGVSRGRGGLASPSGRHVVAPPPASLRSRHGEPSDPSM